MNLGTKRIAGFTSEVLVLGAMETPTQVILLTPDRPAPNGSRIA
jgi:tRNA-binding protein